MASEDEDFFDDGTRAGKRYDSDSENENETAHFDIDNTLVDATPSKLRIAATSIALTKGNYAGKVISRKALDDKEDMTSEDEGNDEMDSSNLEDTMMENTAAADVLSLMRNFEAQDAMVLTTTTSCETQEEKGMQVKNQKLLWEDLLELQIFIKRLMSAVHAGGSVEPAIASRMTTLFTNLFQIQHHLIQERLVDEPIESALDIWTPLSRFQTAQLPSYEETLTTWWRKTTAENLVAKKLKIVQQGVMAQVNSVMSDPERVARKAHGNENDEELDTSSYNDFDFYKALLKEYIENGNAMGISGQGIKKKKRKNTVEVDRRASKGRKLRYEVHAKLEHFMFPNPGPPAPIDSAELMRSLFGGTTHQ